MGLCRWFHEEAKVIHEANLARNVKTDRTSQHQGQYREEVEADAQQSINRQTGLENSMKMLYIQKVEKALAIVQQDGQLQSKRTFNYPQKAAYIGADLLHPVD